MAATPKQANAATTSTAPLVLDAAVIGAGVAGLYQLYLLRQQGLDVKGFEAGSAVGGTWYWNRYPGARFDSESHIYQYLFSEDLYKGWSWSERFPGQPEIERWMNYVADELDLRKDIQFDTRIVSAHYDEARGRSVFYIPTCININSNKSFCFINNDIASTTQPNSFVI